MEFKFYTNYSVDLAIEKQEKDIKNHGKYNGVELEITDIKLWKDEIVITVGVKE